MWRFDPVVKAVMEKDGNPAGFERLSSTDADDAALLEDEDTFVGDTGPQCDNTTSHVTTQRPSEDRTMSASDVLLGEMNSLMTNSPRGKRADDGNLLEDAEVIEDERENSHEDIIDLQADADTTLDDQFEVLDTAAADDHVAVSKVATDRTSDVVETKSDTDQPSPHLSAHRSSGEKSRADKSSSEKKEKDISPIRFDGSKKNNPTSEYGAHKIVDKLFINTRYFVMKSNNFENIDIAKNESVWSTPPYNEKKLNKSYRECKNVLLIFSVKESGRFQGFARLISDSRRDVPMPRWVLPGTISIDQLGGVFKLDWIHQGELEFGHTLDLKNPWNDNKPVKISRDGQEVEPTVGEALCRLWSNPNKIVSTSSSSSSHHHHHSSVSSKFASRLGTGGHYHHHHSSGASSSPSSQQQSQGSGTGAGLHPHASHLASHHQLYAAPFMHPAAYQAMVAQQQHRSGLLSQMMGSYHPHHQGYGSLAGTTPGPMTRPSLVGNHRYSKQMRRTQPHHPRT